MSRQRGESAAEVAPEVPSWVGWAGFGLFIVGLVSLLLPWLVFSFWCYRRGRREGTSLDEDVEPRLSYFPTRLGGWLLASIFLPIVDWFTAVHVPTMCYQQGLRVGASERESESGADEWFTGVPQMVVAAAVVTLAVWVGVGGVAYARFATNDSEQPAAHPSAPTVSPTPTPWIDCPGMSYLEELELRGRACPTATPTPSPGIWRACMDFADRWIPDRSARPDGWILFNDWCNRCQGPDNVSVQPVAPGSTKVEIACK